MKGFWILIILILFLLAIILIPSLKIQKDADTILQEALSHYQGGEESKTIASRKENFNTALQNYLNLEKNADPKFGNGKLYYNIANSFFQLSEYPWAVLYYNKAINLMPRNEEVRRNLSIALNKLNLPKLEENNVYHSLFFFHYLLSVPEQLQSFFISGLLLLALLSLYIWKWHPLIKYGIALAGAVCFIFLLSLSYAHYIEPVQGVMVQASALYRDAGMQYAKAVIKPVPAGLKVDVLNSKDQGQWLKIVTPDGNLGYVPMESIRLI